jgi:hypothetical protein
MRAAAAGDRPMAVPPVDLEDWAAAVPGNIIPARLPRLRERPIPAAAAAAARIWAPMVQVRPAVPES